MDVLTLNRRTEQQALCRHTDCNDEVLAFSSIILLI